MFDAALFPGFSFEGLDSLLDVYHELDEINNSLRSIPGLNCPQGCSLCCRASSINIEVTVFELIPLCLHLQSINMLDQIYDSIQRTVFSAPCVMLSSDKDALSAGGCSCYMWRPLICRLFGFSAVRDKYGVLKFSICRVMKEYAPHLPDIMREKINKGLSLPVNSSVSLAVSQLNPYLGSARYGINEALSRSIEIVGLKLHHLKRQNHTDDDYQPNRPTDRKIA